MKEITIKELAEMIEAVHEAIDATSFGPVFQYSNENNPATGLPNKIVSPLGAQVFVSTLTQFLVKSDSLRIIPNPPESMIET